MSLWPQVIEKLSETTSIHQQASEPLTQQAMQAFWEFQSNLMQQNPEHLAQTSLDWWQQSVSLSQQQFQQFMQGANNDAQATETDRRFRHSLWSSNPFYENLKEQYKLTANLIDQTLEKANENLDERSAHLVEFYGKQWRDALSPSNYPWSNPEVLNHALETNGESLVSGLENFIHDLEQGRITMAPDDSFTLGKDIACTPGKVVFENELMQLIQYEPSTPKVHKIPLLIVPAWINKYYILDLQPENSLVKWLTDQGFTVFIVSWVNPEKKHQNIRFDDYLMLGAWEAAQTVLDITGEEQLHIAGYCLGGTLVSSLLAWLKAENEDDCIASATFLTTLVDFEKAGDLKIFISESQLDAMESVLDQRGYLEGNDLAAIFNALRPQDLFWSFVINNYLLGKTPISFDLLYWNSDVTHMPAKTCLYYLREMYLNNNLAKGSLTLAGRTIKPDTVTTPSYMLATKEDHIAPWEATYRTTQLFKGENRFVLSSSGHVAGVINPPHKKKYGWQTAKNLPESPLEWLESTKEHEGSWWDDWKNWLTSHNKQMVEARKIKKPLETAPGSYAQKRA